MSIFIVSQTVIGSIKKDTGEALISFFRRLIKLFIDSKIDLISKFNCACIWMESFLYIIFSEMNYFQCNIFIFNAN